MRNNEEHCSGVGFILVQYSTDEMSHYRRNVTLPDLFDGFNGISENKDKATYSYSSLQCIQQKYV